MIISIAVQKGGAGKTTTAWAMASSLRRQGRKVLLVDLDPQRNLSKLMKANTNTDGTSLALFLHTAKAGDIIQHTDQGDIIPAGKNLQVADLALKDKNRKEFLLRDSLSGVKGYDFIVLDCPPSLGMVTVNALTASDAVIIPVEASGFSLDGLDDIADTVEQVKRYCNPKLKISGILLTRFEPNTNLSKAVVELAEDIAGRLKTRVFPVQIRNSVKLREAQMLRTDLFLHAGNSNPARDYASLTEDFLKGEHHDKEN